MRKKLPLVMLLLCSLFLVACPSKVDDPIQHTISVDPGTLNFLSGSTESLSISVTTNDTKWRAEFVNEADASWLTITPNISVGKVFFKTKSENTNIEPRWAKVKVLTSTGNDFKEVTITQLGLGPALILNTPSFSFEDIEPKSISVEVTANLEYEVSYPDWIVENKTKAMKEYKHDFVVSKNETGSLRTGKIIFKSKNPSQNVEEFVEISQAGGNYIVVPKDILFRPIAGRALNDEFQPGSGVITNSFDGNMETAYHSRWSGATVMPVVLEYDMPLNAERIDYVFYHSRDGNGNFGDFEIWANTREDLTFVKINDYSLGEAGGSHMLFFPAPVVNPNTFKFVIKSGAGGYASCGEMEFYQNAKADENVQSAVAKVFVNSACMEVKPTATEDDIKALPLELQLIAKEIKEGTYSKEFRCETYKAYSSSTKWAAINVTRPFNKLDNPTGIEVTAGEKFFVFVGPTHGNTLALLNVTNKLISGETYPIREGINEIVPKASGQLYLSYYVDDLKAASAKPIDVHIPKYSGGHVVGYFNVDKHKTSAELQRLLSINNTGFTPTGTFVMQGKRVQLNFLKADLLRNSASDVVEALGIWDEMIEGHWKLLGIDVQFPADRNNRQLATSTVGTDYMYATDFFTYFVSSTVPTRMKKSSMFATRDYMWGPAHEFGHQVDRALSWHGYSEASNNLFSNLTIWQYAQKYGTSAKTGGPGMQLLNEYSYNRGLNFMNFPFDRIPSGQQYDGTGLFLELRLTWQLYVYYHIAGVDTEFFPKFFKLLRSRGLSGTPQEKSMQFYQHACDATGSDLTEFFEAWGWFNLIDKDITQYGVQRHRLTQEMVDAAKKTIKDKSYPKAIPIQYIDDRQVMDAETQGWNATLGEVGYWTTFRDKPQVSANVSYSQNGNSITVTNGDKAVAFEIRENSADGKVVCFSVRFNFDTDKLTGNRKLYAVQADGTRIEIPKK